MAVKFISDTTNPCWIDLKHVAHSIKGLNKPGNLSTGRCINSICRNVNSNVTRRQVNGEATDVVSRRTIQGDGRWCVGHVRVGS